MPGHLRMVFGPAMLTQYSKNKERNKRKSWGRAGIEPATSPTRTENHTSRPTARVPVKVASSEDRTRDLALTRRMLCQLSYRGEDEANPSLNRANRWNGGEAKKFASMLLLQLGPRDV